MRTMLYPIFRSADWVLRRACGGLRYFRWLLSLRRWPASCRGAAAIQIALLLVAIIGFVSLGVEVVLALDTQRRMQAAADSAALAAATANHVGYPSPYSQQAYAIAGKAGFADGQGAGCEAIPAVYVGAPCDGPHANDSDYVEVLIRQPYVLALAKVVFPDEFVLHGRAVATVVGTNGCAGILDPSDSGALKVNGTGAHATLANCTAWVNSSASAAVQVTGGATLACDHLYVGGSASGVDNTLCPTGENAPSIPDPYSDVTTPSPSLAPACTTPNAASTIGPSSGTVVTICKGIDLSKTGDTVNLCPGVYIIDGAVQNSKFKMTSGTSVNSLAGSDPRCVAINPLLAPKPNGVAIVLTSSGSASQIPTVDVSGGTMNLTGLPAADSATGLPVETLFFQDRRAASNHTNSFSGTTTLTGILYFPSQPVVFNGNASGTATCFEIVAWTLSIGGTPSLDATGCDTGTRRIGGQAILVE
ncbi:MAG: pilus assembly protein TadG-related protein [Thiohalocapsa sp.]